MNILGKIDKKIFWISTFISGIFIIWTMISPEAVQKAFDAILNFFIDNFGWYYLIIVAAFLVFGLVLAFSKYGKIKLGKDNEKPEYSTMSWIAMTFSAGMGIGLVFWSVAEPMMHFTTSPLAAHGSAEAANVAMRYTFMHWGLHPWAIYTIVALPLAYFQFRKGLPCLISSTFYPILGEEGIKGPIGKGIDILAVVVTLFGVANSLGMGAMQITSGMSYLWGVPNNNTVSIILIAVVTVLFTISAVTGIKRGIKWLSNTNMIIAFVLMGFIFIVGPSKYIMNLFTESFGQYLQNIVWMSFFLDTQGTVAEHTGYNWVGAWTVFYWAWWIVWAPFVGAFFARISRGRTIKEFVLGVLIAPTILSFLWMVIFGGAALHIDLFGVGGIADAVAADLESALFVTFSHFPMAGFFSVLLMVMIAIFFITSADSATFVMGMMVSGGELEPKSSLKVVLGILEGFIAAMLLLAGGLSAVQTVSFGIGFPFTIVMLFMMYCLMKAFRSDPLIKEQVSSSTNQIKTSADNNSQVTESV